MGKDALHTPFNERFGVVIRTIPFVAFIIMAKSFVSFFGLEFLSLSVLFAAVISADIFLIGFLAAGALAGYKESEKIPGEMASIIEALADEGYVAYKNHKSDEARDFLFRLRDFNKDLIAWFYRREKTQTLMKRLFRFNEAFAAFEKTVPDEFVSAMKLRRDELRHLINRSTVIRETSFLGTGYAITEMLTALLAFGLVFVKYGTWQEGIFLVSFASFVLLYMIFFIRDLDNPFGYGERGRSSEEVSLRPLVECRVRIENSIHRREVSRYVVTLRDPLKTRISNYFVNIKDIPKKYAPRS